MKHATFVVMRKFLQLPYRDRLLLLEAVLCLAVARLAIVALPFRHVATLAARPIRIHEPMPQARAIAAKRIRWAILTCACRVPWRAMCFEQGLAAQFMLRRKGIPSILYYGAAPDDQEGLSAHVWVRDGDVDIIGGEIASQYAVLAIFPPQPNRN